MRDKHLKRIYERVEKILSPFWIKIYEIMKESTVSNLEKLNAGKNREVLIREYVTKMVVIILGILFMGGCFFVISLFSIKDKGELKKGNVLEREKVGGISREVELQVEMGNEKKEVSLDVSPRIYSREQLEIKFDEAEKYIKKNFLGENADTEHITKKLIFMEDIPGSALTVQWGTDTTGIIGSDGSVNNKSLENEEKRELSARIYYGEESREVVLNITILPREKTYAQELWQNWSRALKKSDEDSAESNYMKLPEKVKGKRVVYSEKTADIYKYILAGVFFCIPMVPALMQSRIKEKVKVRDREMIADYPELLEQFLLFIGAGLSIKGAWIRIATDYEKNKTVGKIKEKYVYEEMLVTVREMESGAGEVRAYEMFGKRTGLLDYMKFTALLTQNVKKGSSDLIRLLEYETKESFRIRKERARTMGEEAGTKLLVPMFLMLGLVFGIILFAAFCQTHV